LEHPAGKIIAIVLNTGDNGINVASIFGSGFTSLGKFVTMHYSFQPYRVQKTGKALTLE